MKLLTWYLLQVLDTIEIEVDPLSAPEKIVVDISGLEEDGDAIRVGEIQLPEGAVLVEDEQSVIVRIERSRLQISAEEEDEEAEGDDEDEEAKSGDDESDQEGEQEEQSN